MSAGLILGLLFVCALLSAGVLAFSLTLRLPAWVCVLNAFVVVLNLALFLIRLARLT